MNPDKLTDIPNAPIYNKDTIFTNNTVSVTNPYPNAPLLPGINPDKIAQQPLNPILGNNNNFTLTLSNDYLPTSLNYVEAVPLPSNSTPQSYGHYGSEPTTNKPIPNIYETDLYNSGTAGSNIKPFSSNLTVTTGNGLPKNSSIFNGNNQVKTLTNPQPDTLSPYLFVGAIIGIIFLVK